jgi:hypothetical protein
MPADYVRPVSTIKALSNPCGLVLPGARLALYCENGRGGMILLVGISYADERAAMALKSTISTLK